MKPPKEPGYFRRILEQLPAGILITDDRRRCVVANAAACRLLQTTQRGIIGQRIGHFSAGLTPAEKNAMWHRFVQGRLKRFELHVRLRNGAVRPVMIRGRPHVLPGLHLFELGDISPWKRAATKRDEFARRLERTVARRTARMVALTQRLQSDLLRRRAVERALRISERHYRSLFESTNDAIIVFEPGRETILEANPAAAKLYGFNRRELIGRSLLCLTADVVAGRRKIRALLASGGPTAFETIHYRKDGTPLILAGSASVIEHGGRRAIRGIIRDITAQKKAELALRESEQRLRTAMNASLDAIYLMASVRDGRGRIADFRFTEVNARGLALVSADRATVIGALVTRLFPVVRRRGLFDRYVRVVETGQPLEETFLLESPGPPAKWPEPKWLHHQIVRLADGVLITTRDVTEQKRTELALRALPHRISQAQEAERRCVARDLHDSVSQLLASARFRIQQVQELARNGGHDALATHAVRADFALQSAAGEVRRISHRLRPRELDDLGLFAALHVLLAEFRSRTGLRTVLSSRNSRPKIPAPVAEALYRIAQEALTNIERHARARRVWLSLRHTPAHATLTITDDGRGLSQADRRHATGQGLLHMRERAELAGGSFALSSGARRGTKLVAQIPLRPRKNPAGHA